MGADLFFENDVSREDLAMRTNLPSGFYDKVSYFLSSCFVASFTSILIFFSLFLLPRCPHNTCSEQLLAEMTMRSQSSRNFYEPYLSRQQARVKLGTCVIDVKVDQSLGAIALTFYAEKALGFLQQARASLALDLLVFLSPFTFSLLFVFFSL